MEQEGASGEPAALALGDVLAGAPEDTALVLGAGGLVGIAYLAGTLHGIRDYFGAPIERSGLVVGTSAGSVVGAYLRSGWDLEELAEAAFGRQDYIPEAMRRSQGSPLAAGASVLATALSVVGRVDGRLRRFLLSRAGGGAFDFSQPLDVLERDLEKTWPAALWLVSYDLRTGRRVVLGRDSGLSLTLPEGVAASCAIPGVYPGVRADGRLLVDGGVTSTTHADLAWEAGFEKVLVIAPMAAEDLNGLGFAQRVLRSWPTRALGREVSNIRRQGGQVAVIAPTAYEASLHGLNFMSRRNLPEIYRLARARVAALREALGARAHSP